MLLLPGRRYGPGRPLLYFAARCALAAGWESRTVRWPGADPHPEQVRSAVADAAGPDVARQVRQGRLMVVAKSLGSHAIPWAAEYDVPGVWLTPKLREEEIASALPQLPASSLLVGGTGDPYWDAATAASSGLPVLQIEDADHSLEVSGDVHRSITALDTVVSAIIETLHLVQAKGS